MSKNEKRHRTATPRKETHEKSTLEGTENIISRTTT